MLAVHATRTAVVAETIDGIRKIEKTLGVTDAGLDAIQARLATLAAAVARRKAKNVMASSRATAGAMTSR